MAFFLIVITIFSLGIGVIPFDLRTDIALAVIWVSALFAVFLPLERTFDQDYRDGSLEMILAHQPSLIPVSIGYVLGRWLFNAFPILWLLPVAAWILGLSSDLWLMLTLTITIGSVVFIVFGLVGASLTLGVERGGVLTALLILPLYISVILLGIGVVQQFSAGLTYGGALAGIGAIAIASLTFGPIAIATMLRHSLEY